MNDILKVFIVIVKTLILFASVGVLPFWLALYQDVPVLYAVGGSLVLTVFLTALWTIPRSGGIAKSETVAIAPTSKSRQARLGY
jgi:hypothetical protein